MVNRADETGPRPHALDAPLAGRRRLPDSQKVGVFGDDPGARIMARRESDVDYWDGEA